MADLNDILDAIPATEQADQTDYPEISPDNPVPAEDEEKPVVAAEPETEDKGEKDEATAPPAEAKDDEQDGPSVPRKALEAERHKRQELERQLQQLQQTKPPEDPEPDPYEDPEGHREWSTRQNERRDFETRKLLFTERCNISEMLVRQTVGAEKYDAAYAEFVAAVEENPALQYQLAQQPNPAQFAFDEGNKRLLLKEIGDPVSYRDRLKAEILAELKAEKPADDAQPKPDAKTPDLPQSLADVKSSAARKGPEWGGPTPLENLLPT